MMGEKGMPRGGGVARLPRFDVLAWLDLSDALAKVRDMVRSVDNPATSAILALIFGALAATMVPLAWYLDIDSTVQFGTALADTIAGAGWNHVFSMAAGWLLMGLTALPTLGEFAAPMLARHNIAIAKGFVVVLLGIDAYTDMPRVNALLLPYRPDGFFSELVWSLVHYPILFFATFGCEFLVVICTVAALMFLTRAATLAPNY